MDECSTGKSVKKDVHLLKIFVNRVLGQSPKGTENLSWLNFPEMFDWRFLIHIKQWISKLLMCLAFGRALGVFTLYAPIFSINSVTLLFPAFLFYLCSLTHSFTFLLLTNFNPFSHNTSIRMFPPFYPVCYLCGYINALDMLFPLLLVFSCLFKIVLHSD